MSAVASLPAEATGLLYERHHQRIFGFCLSQLGSREDAEDAVQTTFINAQRGLRRGVVPEFELAWLFTIARNVCHNTRESASRRGRVEAVRDIEALQDVVALPERGGDVSPAELMQALGALPERQRHALLLRELQGLSYYEIAKELAVSVAAVETLIFRARRSVAEQLGRKQTRGLLAWMLALVRWPFQSGAVPLKLAAVTTTIATTATLAVVPAMREPARAPAPMRYSGRHAARRGRNTTNVAAADPPSEGQIYGRADCRARGGRSAGDAAGPRRRADGAYARSACTRRREFECRLADHDELVARPDHDSGRVGGDPGDHVAASRASCSPGSCSSRSCDPAPAHPGRAGVAVAPG